MARNLRLDPPVIGPSPFASTEAYAPGSLAPGSYRPRSLIYPALGVLLALGAPGGLMLLRRWIARDLSLRGAWLELGRDGTTFAYLTISTMIVFVLLGVVLGRSVDRLREGATTDPLTSIANRRYFHDRVTVELKRARREQKPVSIMLVDVDHLKRINDENGHESGDAALRRVARALVVSARATDLVARWGGDEFIALMPATSAEEALQLAARVRAALLELPRTTELAPPTVSIGITDLAHADEPTSRGLYAAADAALYAAKVGGKDRAVTYPPPLRAPA